MSVSGYKAAAVGHFGRPRRTVQFYEVHEGGSFSERPTVLSVHRYVSVEVPVPSGFSPFVHTDSTVNGQN